MEVINVFAQVVGCKLSTLVRRLATPCYPHSLNSSPVSVYRDVTCQVTTVYGHRADLLKYLLILLQYLCTLLATEW